MKILSYVSLSITLISLVILLTALTILPKFFRELKESWNELLINLNQMNRTTFQILHNEIERQRALNSDLLNRMQSRDLQTYSQMSNLNSPIKANEYIPTDDEAEYDRWAKMARHARPEVPLDELSEGYDVDNDALAREAVEFGIVDGADDGIIGPGIINTAEAEARQGN